MRRLLPLVCVAVLLAGAARAEVTIRDYKLPDGDYPHDVAADPAPDGPVWYSAQRIGALGRLDPATGKVEHIPLGKESAPHGVIVGPDGAPWLTDGGQNAIVRVDPATRAVKAWPLPAGRNYANLNTAAFDRSGTLWFTGQDGVYGRLDPRSGEIRVWEAPKGVGPYGITATPDGAVYYASLAGSYLGRIDPKTGEARVIEPPTPRQGARRAWSDSAGKVWVSEWNSGQVSRYDPATGAWKSWKLPGDRPRAYAVYVDADDFVWLSEWNANAIVRFDPRTEKFASFPSPRPGADVRQINGRKGEVWIPESGTDHLRVIRTR
jgi:virginiamycin B lyase